MSFHKALESKTTWVYPIIYNNTLLLMPLFVVFFLLFFNFLFFFFVLFCFFFFWVLLSLDFFVASYRSVNLVVGFFIIIRMEISLFL
jgi:hypothetical protein